MTSLEDIKNSSRGSNDWHKFGSKSGDPFLSVFNEGIKKTISEIQYVPGESYNFSDAEFEYKIDVEQVDEKPKFTFYIKPKKINTEPPKNIPSKDNNILNKYLLIGVVVFVLIELLVLLMGGVFQALF